MIRLEDIKDFLNTKTDYPKWNGKVLNLEDGSGHILTQSDLAALNDLTLLFGEDRVRIIVTDFSFRIFRDENYGYYIKSVVDKDISDKWQTFMVLRNPEYAGNLQKYAKAKIAEVTKQYEQEKTKLLAKLDSKYQDNLQKYDSMLDLAESVLDDDDLRIEF